MKARSAARRGRERALDVVAVAAIALLLAPLGSVAITFATHLASGPGGSAKLDSVSVVRATLGSLVTAGLAIALAFPLAVGCALYVAEYTDSWLAAAARASARVIDGAPPVLMGFAVLGVFGHGLLGATIALALVLVPSVVRATLDALDRVPQDLREAATALGAPRFRGLLLVAWPNARHKATQTVLRGLSRGLVESAPLVVITGALGENGRGAPGLTLSSLAYDLATGAGSARAAYAVALVLTLAVVALQVAASRLEPG